MEAVSGYQTVGPVSLHMPLVNTRLLAPLETGGTTESRSTSAAHAQLFHNAYTRSAENADAGRKIGLCDVPRQVCIGARSVLTCPGDVLRGFQKVQSIHSGRASMVRSSAQQGQWDGK